MTQSAKLAGYPERGKVCGAAGDLQGGKGLCRDLPREERARLSQPGEGQEAETRQEVGVLG